MPPKCTFPTVFQSTLPARERPSMALNLKEINYISIHAPREGATVIDLTVSAQTLISIHAPREGATLAHLEIEIQS